MPSLPVVDDSQQAKGEADTEGHGHSVLGICGHALEDLPGTNNGLHDGRQPRLGQHDVSSTSSSISGTCTERLSTWGIQKCSSVQEMTDVVRGCNTIVCLGLSYRALYSTLHQCIHIYIFA